MRLVRSTSILNFANFFLVFHEQISPKHVQRIALSSSSPSTHYLSSLTSHLLPSLRHLPHSSLSLLPPPPSLTAQAQRWRAGLSGTPTLRVAPGVPPAPPPDRVEPLPLQEGHCWRTVAAVAIGDGETTTTHNQWMHTPHKQHE